MCEWKSFHGRMLVGIPNRVRATWSKEEDITAGPNQNEALLFLDLDENEDEIEFHVIVSWRCL